MIWPFAKPDLHVLVVCTANVCRSPVAEALLRQQLRTRGLGRRVRVASAGTAVGMPGARPDPRMVALAGQSGASLKGIRARALSPQLLRSSDVIWVMDPGHASAVLTVDADAAPRTELLDPGGEAIPDPFYGDPAGIRAVFERLEELAYRRAAELGQRLAAP